MQSRPDSTPSADVESLLAELSRHGVRVAASGGKLRCWGPEDLLHGSLGTRIRDHKAEILSFLDGTGTGTAQEIPALGQTEPPLSTAQTRLWLMEQMHAGAAHHLPFAVEAEGQLDLEALRTALTRIMARHALLRMRISVRDGEPHQRIDPDATPVLHVLDAAEMSEIDVAALVSAEARQPFDLSSAPPLRLTVLRRGGERFILLFTLHHIAADGTSIGILMQEISAFYREAVTGEPVRLPELPVQYGDYAAWERSAEQEARQDALMARWRDRLGFDLPVTRLPVDLRRPAVQSHAGALEPVTLPADLVRRLAGIGGRGGASLSAVLLAAFVLLVHRYTGDRDLVVGTPAANRGRAETEPLVGLFVNPLPIRTAIDPARGFDDLLGRVQAELVGALDAQDVPFERLVETFQPTRDPGASPLFQLKFQLDRATRDTIDLPGVTLRRLPRQGGTARHDLSLDLTEGRDGVSGHVEYCTALFRPESAAAFARHYETLLASIADAPTRPVATLGFLSDDERHRQLVTWNDSAMALDPQERFPALFEAHVEATPDAIATEFLGEDGSRTETYTALNARTNRLAHHLRARGFGPDKVVGIALDRSLDLAAAWLGVLKSGAAYLPLDPAYPPERLAYMISDSGTPLVLTQSHVILPEGTPRLDLDTAWPEGPETNPEPGRDPEDLAYLIYTSGSTGRPKGVEVPHTGLVNLTRDKIRTCELHPGDRVFSFFSFSFDAHIPDFVMSLGAGGRLVFAPAEVCLPGPTLARALRDSRTTHLTITPSALSALPSEDLPDLRMVLVGGEAPSPELVGRWSKGRIFINGYGPTECTVNASMVRCGNGHPVEPTLRPPANKQLHVLDANLELLPVGAPGELCIGGTGLARGYHGRPGQTAAAFVPDPFAGPARRIYRTGDLARRLPDGRIHVLGRIDSQVKIRGYRIEPGEISRACETHPQVATALVVPRSGAGRDLRLVAYLVARGAAPEEAELRAHLMESLPRYMLPDAFVWLDRIPLTVNGKADLKALPEPAAQTTTGRPPEGPTEIALARIFGALLESPDPHAGADFFDLGGTSLMVTRLVAAVEDRLGVKLRALDLFEASSISALAHRIDGDAEPPMPEDWRADLTLADDIRPAAPVAVPPRLPDTVFLTGATGFVGAHVLARLLEDPDRTVLCLLRGDGMASLERRMRGLGLWTPAMADRIVPVSGDLGQAGLGLSPEDRDTVTSRAGTIVHCGAEVHHAKPYRLLRGANVDGTRAVLELAAGMGCPLHHISTLSALDAGEGLVSESDAAADLPPPQGGYNLSKWVAEQLVTRAAANGLPVTIYRLGSVAGSSRTGILNDDDILARQIRGYLASRAAPEGTALVNIMPADYVADAIVTLTGRPDSVGRVFHLAHSTPVPSDMLFAACAAEGAPVRRLPQTEWQSLVTGIAQSQPDHPLFALAGIGGPQGFTGARWPYSCDETRAALGSDVPEPALTDALFRRYVRGLLADRQLEEEAPA
ncbi:MAG: amino acid adenylation domain-containing protein [Pseudooceanicola nanhaiensis]